MKQPARKVVYKNGPWDGQTGMLRGSRTLTFSIGGKETGSYRHSGKQNIFVWTPTQ